MVFQFALSVFLVVSTFLMLRQLEYLRTKPLGFESDHVLRVRAWDLWERDTDLLGVYRNELIRHHSILGVTTTSHALSNRTRYSHTVEHQGNEIDVGLVDVSYDFLQTMGVSLLEGADFDPQRTGSQSSILVNEALVRQLGWDQPVVGRTLRMEKRDVTVDGVVKDFHVRSLHHTVRPAVLRFTLNGHGNVLVRIRPENISGTLAFIKEKWLEVAPDIPFQYSFLDDEVDGQYRKEERWNRIIGYAALLAVFIACLGAFGLTALCRGQTDPGDRGSKSTGRPCARDCLPVIEGFRKARGHCKSDCLAVGVLCDGSMAAGLRVSDRTGHRHVCIGWDIGAAGRAADSERPGHPGGVGESGGRAADRVKRLVVLMY